MANVRGHLAAHANPFPRLVNLANNLFKQPDEPGSFAAGILVFRV